MAENKHREGEYARTPEEIAEGILKAEFAANPLTPEEIERVFRNLKNEGINPDVGPVIRKVLKDKFSRHGDKREIGSLIAFCKKHIIFYKEDFNEEEMGKLDYIYEGYMAGRYL